MSPNDTPSQPAPPVTGAWRPGDDPGQRKFHTVTADRAFRTESGASLTDVVVAYETWGALNDAADNAVLLCHALTGDSHAVGDPGPGHPTPGWWDGLVGPGRYVDTDRWFVVCSNVLGGCQGSTGPASTDPATGRPYGSSFPVVTVRDMVRAQHSLAVGLGIDRWHAVVGGSMGGMQALEWAVMYPDAVANLVLCSTTAQASAQQVAWSHIGRNAITEDAYFSGGDYYDQAEGPHRGLSVARKAAHVTYRSDESFTERFGREMRDQFELTFDTAFEVEHYLDHQGDKLVRRFDANSYIVLNRAMDYHDVGRGRGGTLPALSRVGARTLVASISSDGLYPPAQQIDLHAQLLAGGVTSEMLEVVAPDGHDGFLTRTDDIGPHVRALIERGPRTADTEEDPHG